jgi:predicted ATPase
MHFSEFMLKVHEMEHKVNQKLKGRTGDTIAVVGNLLAQDVTLFYIDEF